jgi:hypothetical protein
MHAGVGQKDAGLAVGRLAEFTAVLTLDADRLLALFWEVAAIDHQHALGIAQIDRHFAPQLLQMGRSSQALSLTNCWTARTALRSAPCRCSTIGSIDVRGMSSNKPCR